MACPRVGLQTLALAAAALGGLAAPAVNGTVKQRSLLHGIRAPPCDLHAANVPVRGQFLEHQVLAGQASGKVWEFNLDVGCSYRLWEREQVTQCLKGNWVVIIGASQTTIWTSQLANLLVPEALLPNKDNFKIDGVFTLLIDIIIEDGKVVYKNIVTDSRSEESQRIGAHTFNRDQRVLSRVFDEVKSPGAKFSPKAIRITNFFAEWWDNVDLAVQAVDGAQLQGWNQAKVTLAVTVGLWYINTYQCSETAEWCATRPEYGKLSLDKLMVQYRKDMERTLTKLEPFCSRKGRAKELGCAVATIDHCQFMQGEIWHRTYDVVKDVMKQRATPLFRFVDLWTFTLQIPEDCVGGHQSPMSTLWTWQLLLGGVCKSTKAAPGTLAAFRGETCRAADVERECADPEKLGFSYKWECGLAKPCDMAAVVAPQSLAPAHATNGVVVVDFLAASHVLVQPTWVDTYRAGAGGRDWLFAGLLLLLTVPLLLYTKPCLMGATQAYSPLSNEDGSSPKGHNRDAEMGKALSTKSASLKNGAKEADTSKAGGGTPATADRFAFGPARLLASLHVVAGHMYAREALPGAYIFSWGFTWVPWFFMLSGFILHTAEARRPRQESAMDYVCRRAAAIYPLYGLSLVIAAVIAKSSGQSPGFMTLLLEAWLGQAWFPFVVENTLQMQCWFLSCLLLYWASFKAIHAPLAKLSIKMVAGSMAVLFLLPWLMVWMPAAMGDTLWYEEHVFGRMDSPVDFAVAFLKFHPLCYAHIFVLGMLLAQLRLALEPHAAKAQLQTAMQALAPGGYLLLLFVFCIPVLRPPGVQLSARLSVLLPLQSAVLLGLAGLPGAKLPFLAAKFARLNFLESYAYSIYVFQFVCYHMWPTEQVGIAYFIALACLAVLVSHLVQKPAEKLLKGYPRRILALPAVVSILVLIISLFPDPYTDRGLPPFLELDDGVVDIRLSLRTESSTGDAVINPSLLFRNGGLEMVIAARKHRRTSERSSGVYDGKDVILLEETWHSDVVLGTTRIDDAAWSAWLSGDKPLDLPTLSAWSGLKSLSGQQWSHLCVRERFLPENNTLIRLRVTGPEDPKVFKLFPDAVQTQGVDVAFNSYPPLGRHGCGTDMSAVSQMYIARGVDPDSHKNSSYGVRMECGHDDRAEKNWIPFQHYGRLYFVYSVLPHVVVEVFADGRCGQRYYSNFAPLVRLQQVQPTLAVRGSAQALFVDDPLATANLPRAHYLGLLHIVDPKTHRYAHFAYRFNHEAPFEIMQVSSQLPLLAARASDGGEGFAFASGLALRGSQVVISYAAGDAESRVLIMAMERLDALFAGSQSGDRSQVLDPELVAYRK